METSDGYAKIIKTIESIISKYKSETFGIVSMYPTNVSILDNFYEKFKDKISDFLIVSNSAKKRKDLDITIVKDKLWKEKETSNSKKWMGSNELAKHLGVSTRTIVTSGIIIRCVYNTYIISR